MTTFDLQALAGQLRAIAGEDRVFEKEAMSGHTSFRVGGSADLFVTVETPESLAGILQAADEAQVPVYLLGRGTNVLVGDSGIRGIVLVPALEKISVEDDRITAGAGVSLSALARTARDAGLAGLEFAAGIPGSVGGAMVMNAGAYGGEMKDVTESCLVMERTSPYRVYRLSPEELAFGYRDSVFKKKNLIALETVFSLQPGDPAAITAKMQELGAKRIEKQPLEYPSAGSTFKRPAGDFAGRLIEASGLRGYRVGGAQVSEKHCGFVINTGNATALDVLKLTEDVIRKVSEDTGTVLEREVILLGEF